MKVNGLTIDEHKIFFRTLHKANIAQLYAIIEYASHEINARKEQALIQAQDIIKLL